MTFAELIEPVLARRDMTPVEAAALMEFLMSGEATDAQIGGFLVGLRTKGCTTRELAAFAQILRKKAATIHSTVPNLVDTCGTGGGVPTFNISTAAAIVAAAAGAKIAKHGNRSMTGLGSADVLEALGVPIGGEPARLLEDLETEGIVFLFAPTHHPAMRYVGPARKQLGIRTVFNQLGPLANPAGARRQLIGVYQANLMRSMGEALKILNADRALLVHGTDGMDEISPVADTEFVKLWDGRITTGKLTTRDFGLSPIQPEHLEPGKDIDENAQILREAISDVRSPRAQAILPSAAAAIWIAGLEDELPVAVERAHEAIRSGAAMAKLDGLIGVPA